MAHVLDTEFTFRNDFPPVGYDAWRAIAEESLSGRSFDELVTHTDNGISIQPLYTERDELGRADPFGFPGLAPFLRGSHPLGAATDGWDLRQEHAHPIRSAANRDILADVEGGARSIVIRWNQAVRGRYYRNYEGVEHPADLDGVIIDRLDDLDEVLASVPLHRVGVCIDSGSCFLPTAALLVGLWRHRGIPSTEARGAFCADPIGTLARYGGLPVSPDKALERLTDLAIWTAAHYPRVTAVGVDAVIYHEAGATATQELAFGMATALEYLRAMTRAGLNIDAAAQQILFRMAVDTDYFLSIAKLRAARWIWSRIVHCCGGSETARAMRIHAQTSRRILTQRDPHVNLLRNAVAVFAAGIGGAEAITSVPFDTMLGVPGEFSRRIARNTLHVLQEEGHLQRVIDPAGGSWFLDQLTEQLADKAWSLFQQVEARGGMLAAIQSSWIAHLTDEAHARRAWDVAHWKRGITGVSQFPNVQEIPLAQPVLNPLELQQQAAVRAAGRPTNDDSLRDVATAADPFSAAIAAVAAGASIGDLAGVLGFHRQPASAIRPLRLRPLAQPFEQLRDASDAWNRRNGRRPRVFLATLGPIAQTTERVAFARNFFEAGGFEVVVEDACPGEGGSAAAFAASRSAICVLCSPDKLDPQFGPDVVPQFKAAGARRILLVAAPPDNEQAWRSAGVDQFVDENCDMLQTLRSLLYEEGVL